MTQEKETPKDQLLAEISAGLEHLPAESRKHWRALTAAAALTGAATAAGFAYLLWKARQEASQKGAKITIDTVVKDLPEPSPHLSELSVVEPAIAVAQKIKELPLRSRISALSAFISVLDEIGTRLRKPGEIESDDLIAAAAAIGSREAEKH